jgi:hypothetical protein
MAAQGRQDGRAIVAASACLGECFTVRAEVASLRETVKHGLADILDRAPPKTD